MREKSNFHRRKGNEERMWWGARNDNQILRLANLHTHRDAQCTAENAFDLISFE